MWLSAKLHTAYGYVIYAPWRVIAVYDRSRREDQVETAFGGARFDLPATKARLETGLPSSKFLIFCPAAPPASGHLSLVGQKMTDNVSQFVWGACWGRACSHFRTVRKAPMTATTIKP